MPCVGRPRAERCYVHGGATKAARAKSDRAVEVFSRQKALARAVAQMGGMREVHPLDALLESVWTASAMVTGLREPVGELEPGYSTSGEGVAGPDHLGDGRPHVFASMLREWTAELGRLSKLALDAGIDERRVRMNEAEGHFLASVIRSAIDACSPDDETRAAAIQAAAKLIRERDLHAIG